MISAIFRISYCEIVSRIPGRIFRVPFISSSDNFAADRFARGVMNHQRFSRFSLGRVLISPTRFRESVSASSRQDGGAIARKAISGLISTSANKALEYSFHFLKKFVR